MTNIKNKKNTSLDINDIISHLPHRYPFLLVDKVVDYEIGRFIEALKNVSYNEPYFQGHFPTRPIMPGVLIVEAIAQAAGILAFRTWEDVRLDSNELFFLGGIDKARFKRIVEPGDQMRIMASVDHARRNIWKVKGEVTVEGEMACVADIIIVRSAPQ